MVSANRRRTLPQLLAQGLIALDAGDDLGDRDIFLDLRRLPVAKLPVAPVYGRHMDAATRMRIAGIGNASPVWTCHRLQGRGLDQRSNGGKEGQAFVRSARNAL